MVDNMEKKEKHAKEMKLARANWTPEQIQKNREQSKLRMRRYRERQKQILDSIDEIDKSTIETRQLTKLKEERKTKQREYKRNWRSKLTAQKKRRIREKDAAHKREKRKKATKVALFSKTVTSEQDSSMITSTSNETETSTSTIYKNKESYRKAVYRVRSKLPSTPERYAKIVKGLTKVTPRKKAALEKEGIGSPSAKRNLDNMMNIIGSMEKDLRGRKDAEKKRHREYLGHLSRYVTSNELKTFVSVTAGIKRKYMSDDYLTQKPRKIRKDSTSVNIKEQISDVYSQASQTVPDRKGAKKGVDDKPPAVMNRSINSLWRDWNRNNPNQKMSIGQFYKLRPKNVLTQKHRKIYACLCEYCENTKLKIKAFNKAIERTNPEMKLRDEYEAVHETLCPKEDGIKYNHRDCIYRKCALCGTEKMKQKLRTVIHNDRLEEEVNWQKWETVKTVNRKTNKEISKRQEITKSGTLSELINELMSEIDFLSHHLFEATWQHEQFQNYQKEIPKKSVMIVIDFAENYSCFHQNEIQGAHWAKDSVTIHPCICTYICPEDGQTVDEIVDIISDDLMHDSHAVHAFMTKVIKHLKDNRNLDLEHVVICSDGCAAQYKSKLPFMDTSCFLEDYGVTVERCYYGSRHGKNRCDGEAGVVKSKATRLVKNSEAIITNAQQFYNSVKTHLTKNNQAGCCHKRREFIFVSSTEIRRPRPERECKVVKGTRKLHSILGDGRKGSIKTRNLSCFCSECVDKRYDRCLNTSHVDGWKPVTLKLVRIPVNPERIPVNPENETTEDENDGDHAGLNLDVSITNISFDVNTSFSYINDDDTCMPVEGDITDEAVNDGNKGSQVLMKALFGCSSLTKEAGITGLCRRINTQLGYRTLLDIYNHQICACLDQDLLSNLFYSYILHNYIALTIVIV